MSNHGFIYGRTALTTVAILGLLFLLCVIAWVGYNGDRALQAASDQQGNQYTRYPYVGVQPGGPARNGVPEQRRLPPP